MAVFFKSKYIFLILLVYLDNNVRSMLTNRGKLADSILREKVSNAQEHTALHWPKGIVTYYLDNLSYDYYIAQRVRMAMNILESSSCVKFKPTLIKPSGNMTWIHFTNPQAERNCAHEPKLKDDGEIILVLGFDCLKENEILHTLLHAIGFDDEVSHPHRDQYIRVMWNNIQPEYRYLYRIRSNHERDSQLLVEYDPQSIMHFHDRAFSINGHATVMPLVPGLLISPSEDLSQLDKMRLRLMFDHECNKRKVGDMIDTCKTLLSSNDSPNDLKNQTDSKSEEKDDVSNTDKGNSEEAEKVDETGKGNETGKSDEPEKGDETKEGDKTVKEDDAENGDETEEGDVAEKGDEIKEDNEAEKDDETDEGELVEKGHEIEEGDVAEKGDEIEERDKAGKDDTAEKSNKVKEGNEVDEVNKEKTVNEIDEGKNHAESKSIEYQPPTVLNRIIPAKVLDQIYNKQSVESIQGDED